MAEKGSVAGTDGQGGLSFKFEVSMFQIAAVGRALCDELRSASVRVVCGQPVTTSVFAPLFRSKPSSHESVHESLAWSVRHSPSRVAAGLSGGFRLARYGLFGLRGDARGRCRSRRERIAKPATPKPVLRPLGRAQRQRCRTRRHLPGLPPTEPPPQPAGGPRRRGAACSGQWAQRVGDQLVAEPDVWLQHRPQRTTRRTADGSRTAQIALHGRLTACRSRLMIYPDRADDWRASRSPSVGEHCGACSRVSYWASCVHNVGFRADYSESIDDSRRGD